ncbi:MAG: hypothetical protein ACRYHQ_41495, partial [Janthinobacterium lividum]
MIHGFLEGFSGNPEDGMQLRVAMVYFSDQLGAVDSHGRSILNRYDTLNLRVHLPETNELALSATELREILAFQRVFLSILVDKLRVGIVVARGYTAPGQLQRTLIPADWWTQVQIDLPGNSAEAHGTRILDVLVFPGVEPKVSVPQPVASLSGRLDYTVSDAPLVAEMQALIAAGKARGPKDAARAVADRAEGPGKPASKVTR